MDWHKTLLSLESTRGGGLKFDYLVARKPRANYGMTVKGFMPDVLYYGTLTTAFGMAFFPLKARKISWIRKPKRVQRVYTFAARSREWL